MSRAEQWVVHHVMLQQVEAHREDGESPPWWAINAIEKLEDRPVEESTAGTDRPFTCYEAWRLRRALSEYAEQPETPEDDVAAAVGLVRRLDETFVEPPTALN
ncbi:hypothetical protein ACFQDG_10145 [Natronoarchaeum mannanilyticum]|uniref:Uncharacterized protein n=1 Tax=Natronoarchaeum mannanilyticum TaxID=926360 RepID=A0AAV3TAT9_9EURY